MKGESEILLAELLELWDQAYLDATVYIMSLNFVV
jgi:hypothetical protein